jgi:hypothetical protein
LNPDQDSDPLNPDQDPDPLNPDQDPDPLNPDQDPDTLNPNKIIKMIVTDRTMRNLQWQIFIFLYNRFAWVLMYFIQHCL